jgi:hypothetical protein
MSYASERSICYDCLSDSDLSDLVRVSAGQQDCSFCGRHEQTDVAVDFDWLMEKIRDVVNQYFSTADDECIPYDREEDKYIFATYDTYEVLENLGLPSENSTVNDAIIDSLGQEIWCDRNPGRLDGAELYKSSWERFCEIVKHKARYFFSKITKESPEDELVSILGLLKTIRSLTQDAGMVKMLDVGTSFYRVRHHEVNDVCTTWQKLGSPPIEHAKASRMSPAGVSVFYAALDMDTARAESTLRSKRGWIFTGAKWTNSRPLRVLDLSSRPAIPGVYGTARQDREDVVFLRHFVRSIGEPVVPDDRVHIEYVPTQIVTEYFRYHPSPSDQPFDGIIYPSAQCKGQSIVIFASHDDLQTEGAWGQEETPILTLDQTSIQPVEKYRKNGTKKPKKAPPPISMV